MDKKAQGDLVKSVLELGARIQEVLQPILEDFLESMNRLREYLSKLYRDEGSPYGETDEGFQRWIMEGITGIKEDKHEKHSSEVDTTSKKS